MATNEYLLLVAGILLLLAALASKASTWLGVPALLLFLLLGMLAGSEGIGGSAFDDARLAQLLGTIALIFILFAGGLETPWAAVRPVLWSGLALSTVGVLVTTALVGGFVLAALGYSWEESLLAGAIRSNRASFVSYSWKLEPMTPWPSS